MPKFYREPLEPEYAQIADGGGSCVRSARQARDAARPAPRGTEQTCAIVHAAPCPLPVNGPCPCGCARMWVYRPLPLFSLTCLIFAVPFSFRLHSFQAFLFFFLQQWKRPSLDQASCFVREVPRTRHGMVVRKENFFYCYREDYSTSGCGDKDVSEKM